MAEELPAREAEQQRGGDGNDDSADPGDAGNDDSQVKDEGG